MITHTAPAAVTSRPGCSPAQRVTRSLLGYGVLAGVVFEASILIQGLTRHGFRLAHDDASLLSNGPLGWLQIVTFLVSGAMTIAFAVGARRALGGPRRRPVGAAADRGLRCRADGRRAAARRPGRQRLRARCPGRPGCAGQLARGRASGLRGHLTPSPVIELNRAVAIGMAHGPARGLDLADRLTAEPALAAYCHLPAVRGDLLARLGRLNEAREEFERAAGLTSNQREQALFQARAAACRPSPA